MTITYTVSRIPHVTSCPADLSQACGPTGDGQCDGWDENTWCECFCHDPWEDDTQPGWMTLMAEATTTEQQRTAHAQMWEDIVKQAQSPGPDRITVQKREDVDL